jgi:hypothetical protein
MPRLPVTCGMLNVSSVLFIDVVPHFTSLSDRGINDCPIGGVTVLWHVVCDAEE